MTDKAVVCYTPDSIRFYSLLSIRGRLKLEMKGMRLKPIRGRTMATIVKEMFGLPKSCRNAKALARLEEEIKASVYRKNFERAFETICNKKLKLDLGDFGKGQTIEEMEAMLQGDGVLTLGVVTAHKEVWRDVWEQVRAAETTEGQGDTP